MKIIHCFSCILFIFISIQCKPSNSITDHPVSMKDSNAEHNFIKLSSLTYVGHNVKEAVTVAGDFPEPLEFKVIKGDSGSSSGGSNSSKKTSSGSTPTILIIVGAIVGAIVLFIAMTTMLAQLMPMLDPLGIVGNFFELVKAWFCCTCVASMNPCCTIS